MSLWDRYWSLIQGMGTIVRKFLQRMFDARRDRRRPGDASSLATLTVRAKDHQVAILDISSSGAMIAFDGLAREGDLVTIQWLDHEAVGGQVRWIRDGRAGIYFTRPIEEFARGPRE